MLLVANVLMGILLEYLLLVIDAIDCACSVTHIYRCVGVFYTADVSHIWFITKPVSPFAQATILCEPCRLLKLRNF